jgi:hypothetical protein
MQLNENNNTSRVLPSQGVTMKADDLQVLMEFPVALGSSAHQVGSVHALIKLLIVMHNSGSDKMNHAYLDLTLDYFSRLCLFCCEVIIIIT